MKRLSLAGFIALLGATFFLQGINVLPGSFMTGDPTWAAIGAAMLVFAALLVWTAYRRRAR